MFPRPMAETATSLDDNKVVRNAVRFYVLKSKDSKEMVNNCNQRHEFGGQILICNQTVLSAE